jgi:hypothetical protein
MGMGILYFLSVILSEAKSVCNLADGKKLHRSFASLRVTEHKKREAGIFAASRLKANRAALDWTGEGARPHTSIFSFPQSVFSFFP